MDQSPSTAEEPKTIAEIASLRTRKEFDIEVSRFVALTETEVTLLFPDPPDREELGKLVDIMNGAADESQKKEQLIGRISEVGGAVYKLLSKSIFRVG